MQTLKRYALTITFAALMLLVVLQHSVLVEAPLRALWAALSIPVTGVAFAFVLNLPMSWIERTLLNERRIRAKWLLKIRRGISLTLTVLIVLVIVVWLSSFILPQLVASVSSLVSNAPVYVTDATNRILLWLDGLGVKNEQIVEVLDGLPGMFRNITSITANTIIKVLQTAMEVSGTAMNLFLSVVMAIYMLLSKERLLTGLSDMNRAFCPPAAAETIRRVGARADRLFSKFIGGQLLEALLMGMLCFLGMALFQFPYALLISTLIGFTALIPYVGAFFGTIPAVLIISLISLPQGIGFLVFILLLQQVNGNFIYPKIVGDAIGLDGFWVLVAITLGGSLFGILGMLIGVPVFALLQDLLDEWVKHRLSKQSTQHQSTQHQSTQHKEQL